MLVAIPAYNEGATVGGVLRRVRAAVPDFDLLVVNDGSRDDTERVARELGARVAAHVCNLGYGRAIQTALQYAAREGYDVLITLDADGQHQPEQLGPLYEAFVRGQCDYLIGSRYVETRTYQGSPIGRRIGMRLFSMLTGQITGQRIYDTTSGMKVLSRRVFEPLMQWHFVDFHAEAIVFLACLGFRLGEHPISVQARTHGSSMYSALSHVMYPLKTAMMVLLGFVQASVTRRRSAV